MYCPKCGARAESGKFCRTCGTNLAMVSDALQVGEQGGGGPSASGGGTTIDIFHSTRVTNISESLNGHHAVCVFGHTKIDATAATLPAAETVIHVHTVFGTLDVTVPSDVGFRITGVNIFSTVLVRGEQRKLKISNTNEYTSPGYYDQARRLTIDATLVFSTLRIKLGR